MTISSKIVAIIIIPKWITFLEKRDVTLKGKCKNMLVNILLMTFYVISRPKDGSRPARSHRLFQARI